MKKSPVTACDCDCVKHTKDHDSISPRREHGNSNTVFKIANCFCGGILLETKIFVLDERWDVYHNSNQSKAPHMLTYYRQSITDPNTEFVIVAWKLMVRYLQLAC